MKEPQLLTLQKVFDTLSREHLFPEKHFFDHDFGVVVGMNQFLQPFVSAAESPYLLDDYRMGYVVSGAMYSIINLQKYAAEAGQIVFVTPGTIVEPLGASDDFRIVGLGLSADLFQVAHSGNVPELFCGKQKHGILTVSAAQGLLLHRLYALLCDVAIEQGKENEKLSMVRQQDKQTVYHLIAAITSTFDRLFAHGATAENGSPAAHSVFNRFIQLVNAHCKEERKLSFYADKICLSERYLGTVVRQTSGITAKEWIDKAVVTAAKVMLRHSDKQIAEITDALHFPNPSFFCKYFKRLVGCTPQEYRQGK